MHQPTNRTNRYAKPMPPKCFRCQQPGHRSNECPQKRSVHLIEDTGDNEAGYEDAYAQDFDYGELDIQNGDSRDHVVCILPKLLLTPKQAMNTQRNSFFKTRHTINKKVCNVIIDSRCSENVVFKALVKALGLVIEPHPRPYKIGW